MTEIVFRWQTKIKQQPKLIRKEKQFVLYVVDLEEIKYQFVFLGKIKHLESMTSPAADSVPAAGCVVHSLLTICVRKKSAHFHNLLSNADAQSSTMHKNNTITEQHEKWSLF